MKTRFFTTAIALMALTFVFNSCEKEDDEPFHFPADQVELLLPDGAVVDTTIRRADIVSSTNPDYTVVVMVGTEKDNLSTFMGNDKCVLKIDQKYYWQAKVVDSKSGENSEFSEIRSFYVLDPKMKVTMETDNGETENAIVLRWSDIDHNKYKNIKLQMKPTKECGFAGKTFEIPDGQDSLYIRLADNPEIPYMFNDFDDLGDGNKCFGYFAPHWLLNYTLRGNASNTFGDWAICPSPISYFYGGTWVCANNNILNSDKEQVIGDLFYWIFLDTSPSGFQYSNFKESIDEEYKGTLPSSIAVLEQLVCPESLLGGQDIIPTFIHASRVTNSMNYYPGEIDVNFLFSSYIKSYLEGERTYDEAIDDFRTAAFDMYGIPSR